MAEQFAALGRLIHEAARQPVFRGLPASETASCQRTATLTCQADHDEFVRLVADHGDVVFGVLRRLCGNTTDAEDVFQEVAVRVWRSLASRPALRNPRSWLLAIAYRPFVDFAARRRAADELWDAADTRHIGPSEQAVKVEEAQRVAAAVERLSDPLRSVVLLHYTGGLTLRETAAVLGCSEGTVKSRLNAAITKLRGMLE